MIEDRLGRYSTNPMITPGAEQMKEKFREGIIERAAAARLVSDKDDDRSLCAD
jgi:hypothetical protein